MKKIILSTMTICLFALSAHATIHAISVANFSFTPNTMTINLGDTVDFKWANGTHTTTSLTVPAGGVMWDSNMDVSTPDFKYVPAAVGTYTYECTIHPTLMTGQFTVVNPTGVNNVSSNTALSIYPNPVQNILHVDLAGTSANITLTSINGSVAYKAAAQISANIDVSLLPNGLYFLGVENGSTKTVRAITIAH